MPRFTLSDEEITLIEKLRTKNATDLGYNAGLEQAALLVETGALGHTVESIAVGLRSHKRELKL